MQEILKLVKDYIEQKQANRKWQAGKDFVNYAGPYYNSDEYVAGVESLLRNNFKKMSKFIHAVNHGLLFPPHMCIILRC